MGGGGCICLFLIFACQLTGMHPCSIPLGSGDYFLCSKIVPSSGVARIFQRGRVLEVVSSSHGRAIFENANISKRLIFLYFFCTLNAIIRGRLCKVAQTNLVLIFFSDQQGGWSPCAPLNYANGSQMHA